MEKMYYNNREIILVENNYDDESINFLCRGCVLESDERCVKHISPRQPNTICCPRDSGKFYIFKFV